MDVAHWVVGGPLGRVIADAAVVVGVVSALPLLVLTHMGSEHPPGGGFVTPFMRMPVAIQIPIAIVLVDFFGYWAHRALHMKPLWRFHAIHHSSRDLDWLATARNHPLAEALARVMGGVPVLVAGIDPRVLVGLAPLLLLYAIFLHANVRWTFGPLRWVIATPLFHRWHHSRAPEAHDKNFAGLFPVWDLLFGTLYLPDRQPQDFGVDDGEAVPDGFVGQMLYPITSARTPRRPASS